MSSMLPAYLTNDLFTWQVVKHRADLATTLVSAGAAGALVDQARPTLLPFERRL